MRAGPLCRFRRLCFQSSLICSVPPLPPTDPLPGERALGAHVLLPVRATADRRPSRCPPTTAIPRRAARVVRLPLLPLRLVPCSAAHCTTHAAPHTHALPQATLGTPRWRRRARGARSASLATQVRAGRAGIFPVQSSSCTSNMTILTSDTNEPTRYNVHVGTTHTHFLLDFSELAAYQSAPLPLP